MPTSIFSTYSTGENRVTASILAVLRSLSIQRTERLLGALLGESDFSLVQFETLVSVGTETIPDARILANRVVLFETKIVSNSLREQQLRGHLGGLPKSGGTKGRLLTITPDMNRPDVVDSIGDPRIAWTSFFALDQAIDELISDPREVVSEREQFLLRELQEMLLNEGLLGSDKDVVVVAAREAWQEYKTYSAYICQPDRTFQRVSRIAFYKDGAIQPFVPQVEAWHENVVVGSDHKDKRLRDLMDRLLADKKRDEGVRHKVLLLSSTNSNETIKLKDAVQNNLRAESGRPIAFTQGQRYVSLESLLNAKTTSDLIDE